MHDMQRYMRKVEVQVKMYASVFTYQGSDAAQFKADFFF